MAEVKIPSEQLEPILMRVIGEAWDEVEHGTRSRERFYDMLLTLARVADASGATHAGVALNNLLGALDARHPGIFERVRG